MCRRTRDDDWWMGRRVWIGLDLSISDDNTSVAMAAEEDGNIYARIYSFIPGDRVEEKSRREHLDYKRFIEEGYCYPCGEEVIDYSFIENFIMNLSEKLGVIVVQIGYDRWNALSTVQKLEAEEYECVEIKQHSSVLHMPTKFLKEKILSKEFIYDENRLLEINFENAKCTEDTNLNKYVNKKRSSGKVDMVVSLINAVYLIQQSILFDDGFVVQVI
jgi:phage terminase large subunit-like protein